DGRRLLPGRQAVGREERVGDLGAVERGDGAVTGGRRSGCGQTGTRDGEGRDRALRRAHAADIPSARAVQSGNRSGLSRPPAAYTASMATKLLLASPRGYCAGVDRAVQTVEQALELHGAPVYVRKEIVHNKHVVEQLRERGAIFVDELDESVPE